MSRLSIRLLGSFEVMLDGQPAAAFESDKVRALLAFLAVEHDRPHRREALTSLLWPDWPESSARANLRQALANLRQVIGDHEALPPYLHISRQTIQFNTASEASLDVTTFNEQIDGQPRSDRLETAVELYGGAFLEGFTVRDSTTFEEWALVTRERLARLVGTALSDLVDHYEQHGAYKRALPHAWRLVDLEPLEEGTYSQLMRLLALNGQRSAALEQYETCKRILADELGIEPSTQTRELYDHIASGGWPPVELVDAALEERNLGPPPPCPYRGLAAFREDDASFFFGREVFTEGLVDAIQRQAIVAVIVGSSGSGKSSATYAGLVSRLREKAGWLIVDLRPGDRPFHALAGALLPVINPVLDNVDQLVETQRLADLMNTGEISLADVTGRALKSQQRVRRLLLVIDQFEELYTLCPDLDMRRRFLDELLATAAAGQAAGRRSPYVIVMTLRADFMGEALAYRPFADTLQDATVMLGPMTRNELAQAVEQPARRQGLVFDPGLVNRILDDVGTEPGNLPLLEFALTQLWEHQVNRRLTHDAYEQIGRVPGALTRYAEAVYVGLSDAEREQARRVFVQLVQPGEETADARRRATRDELGESRWALVQHLADERLVVTGVDAAGREIVEVVHEALIWNWEQLRTWLEADRTFRIWQERLRAAIRQWEESGNDEGALLRGAPLVEAETWRDERGGELSKAEADFIQTSTALREKQQAEREQRRRRVTIALAFGLVVALGLSLVAWWQRNAAEAAKQEALRQASIGLAAQARLELIEGAPDRAALLAIEALEHYPYTWQAERALFGIVHENRLAHLLTDHTRWTNMVAWSSDGTRLLSASDDGTAMMWDAETGERLQVFEGHTSYVHHVSWSSDEKQVTTASSDGTAIIWDAGSGTALVQVTHLHLPESGEGGALFSATLSPDMTSLVTTASDGTVKVWDAQSGEELITLSSNQDWVTYSDWSPDGSRFVTAGSDNVSHIWDGTTFELIHQLSGRIEPFLPSIWSPDGSQLVTTSAEDNIVTIWDAETGEPIHILQGAGRGAFRTLAWSPDGTHLLGVESGTRPGQSRTDGRASIWDTSTGELIHRLPGKGDMAFGAWSPDGLQVAVGDIADVIRIWDATSGESVYELRLRGQPEDIRYSPDGDQLAVTYYDGRIALWNMGDPTRLSFSEQNASIGDWSPDGNYFIRGDRDGGVYVTEAETGDTILTLVDTGASHAKWSPDGQFIGVSMYDGTIRILDATSGEEVKVIDVPGGQPVRGIYWSPDSSQFSGFGIPRDELGFDVHVFGVFDLESGEELFEVPAEGCAAIWSPDGTRIASGDWDSGVQIWDATNGDELLSVFLDAALPCELSWSPDGTKLAVPTYPTGVAHIIDAETGEILLTYAGHAGGITAAQYSPDGTRIATAGADSTRIWDASTGEEYGVLNLQDWGVKWSPTGTELLTNGQSGQTRVWTVFRDKQELIDYAYNCCVFRDLTSEEREHFGLPPAEGQQEPEEGS